jgi:guanylate kinase
MSAEDGGATTTFAPLVFAGPSGVGKGTLVNLLMTRYPALFGFSVSHTTRQPREGEENGVHYHFVALADMEAATGRGEFVEFARVHANMYGTSIKAVEDVQSKGKICILDIDIQGVQKVKTSTLQCKYVFIAPPSIEVLETRLRGRGTETEDKIQIRMKTAHDELAFGNVPGNFDAIVVNNDLEEAYAEIVGLLKQWYPQAQL